MTTQRQITKTTTLNNQIVPVAMPPFSIN